MARLVTTTLVSLDGFMVGDDEDMSWVTDSFDPEMGKDIGESFQDTDAILLGRITYEIMASYWPNAVPDGNYDYDNPTEGSEDPIITERMNNLPKIVFSRTLDTLDWNNSRLVNGNIGDEIAILKQQPGKDLMIQGSASIVQQLTNLGLIDEYRLLVHPVVLGSGKPLFSGIKDRSSLQLVDAKTYSNGVIGLRYQRASRG